jgi:pimeloyl-ACP methyl ester carboxylesterase
MYVERLLIPGKGCDVPAAVITPDCPRGSAVVIPGYGGNKEEMLGLAWRIAESGLTACAIDIRGHGEHALPLDGAAADDVEAAVGFCRGHGAVAAVGHSLGGRLALLSSADFAIGISPALRKRFSEQTRTRIRSMRGHRVRELNPDVLFDMLRILPEWDARRKTGIIIGSRDIPEIIAECAALEKKGAGIVTIDQALHGDIFNQEECFNAVAELLKGWFPDTLQDEPVQTNG